MTFNKYETILIKTALEHLEQEYKFYDLGGKEVFTQKQIKKLIKKINKNSFFKSVTV